MYVGSVALQVIEHCACEFEGREGRGTVADFKWCRTTTNDHLSEYTEHARYLLLLMLSAAYCRGGGEILTRATLIKLVAPSSFDAEPILRA